MLNFIQTLTGQSPQPTQLLQNLRQVQAEYRHIPEQAMDLIARAMRIS
jgi:NADH:ubiquinone oxidoreductase subunit E